VVENGFRDTSSLPASKFRKNFQGNHHIGKFRKITHSMGIKENVENFNALLQGKKCTLVAVSKKKSAEDIMEAYNAGHRDFGENRVQELREKQPMLPGDIHWHMIGHLQTNKVKYIAPFVHLIHSVDSLKLLREIDKQAKKNQRTIACLLQVHIAEEESKFGFDEKEIMTMLDSEEFNGLTNIAIRGLMGMATFTEDMDQVRREFIHLRRIRDNISAKYSLPTVTMEELSMGMSDDYLIALEEGSTMVRVGSKIFGPRIK
jgi:pyridoxal phosphate enzyme (YggS family)